MSTILQKCNFWVTSHFKQVTFEYALEIIMFYLFIFYKIQTNCLNKSLALENYRI